MAPSPEQLADQGHVLARHDGLTDGGGRFPSATRLVIAFEDRHSGKRLLDVLGKPLCRYGLTLHETKTRHVDFRRRRPYGCHWMASVPTFDFLRFTHVWRRSRQG